MSDLRPSFFPCLLPILAAVVFVAGCNRSSDDSKIVAPNTGGPVPNPATTTLPDPAGRLAGSWTGICERLTEETSRRTDIAFLDATMAAAIKMRTFGSLDCSGTLAMTYRFNATYLLPPADAWPDATRAITGEVKEAFLTIHDPAYLEVANRPPGFFGVRTWEPEVETSLHDKLTPAQVTALSARFFPKDGQLRIDESGKLYLGENVRTKAYFFTK